MDPRLEGLEEEDFDRVTRPYDCRVGNCTRRYKNMNGLRESLVTGITSGLD